MTLGKTPVQADLFRSTTEFCEPRVKADSIYARGPVNGALARGGPPENPR